MRKPVKKAEFINFLVNNLVIVCDTLSLWTTEQSSLSLVEKLDSIVFTLSNQQSCLTLVEKIQNKIQSYDPFIKQIGLVTKSFIDNELLLLKGYINGGVSKIEYEMPKELLFSEEENIFTSTKHGESVLHHLDLYSNTLIRHSWYKQYGEARILSDLSKLGYDCSIRYCLSTHEPSNFYDSINYNGRVYRTSQPLLPTVIIDLHGKEVRQ